MFKQQLSGLGGRRAAAVAREQGLVQSDFQQPHLAAEHGLGCVQGGGGTGKAAEFGYAHKVFKLLEIHSWALFFAIFT